jgi:GT2 family glycosyltransferase
MMLQPTVSVVIPVQDHDCLGKTLEALAVQEDIESADYEIIVVDGARVRDWTAAVARIAAKRPELRIRFEQIEADSGRARELNVGISHALGSIVLMLADDFVPGPKLVSLHLAAHTVDPDERLVAMGPGLFPRGERTNEFMRWLEESGEIFGARFTDPALKLPPQFFYMANTSIRRTFLLQAGLFDERFPYDAMDDFEMGLRLRAGGMRNRYLPQAIATHEHVISFAERCGAMKKAGFSAAIFDTTQPVPGPWSAYFSAPRTSSAERRRETREQRYRRRLREQFMAGYRQFRLAAPSGIADRASRGEPGYSA